MMRAEALPTVVCVMITVLLALPAAAENAETAISPGGANAAPQLKAGRAGVCMIGAGLASTLLYPYFEVDLADANGVTTLISVNNGFIAPVLTRLVVWTDWGIPTMAFDIWLDGFDVQPINIRHLFDGIVPSTGAGADLTGFPFCGTWPPTYTNPALTTGEIQHLETAHTGQPGHIDGLCYSADHGDSIARGYITVDTVDECSDIEGHDPVFTPANTSYPYFAEGGAPSGIGTINNTLWGDVVFVDFNNDSAQGTEAVAIWADDAEFTAASVYTFYGRHSDYDGRDERVPLPYRWDQRFLNGGPFAGGADLIVFQQPHHFAASPISCVDHPAWWPMETTVATVDEAAGNIEVFGNNIFALVTQRVPISAVGPSYDFGWIQIQSTLLRQMWVQPILTAGGRFSAGYNGFPVEFLCGVSPPMN